MVFVGTDFGLSILDGLTTATGSVFLTLLIIIMILTVLSLGLRIPLEFTAIFILPLMIGVATYTSNIIPVLGATLIYLGVLLGKNIIAR